MPGIGKAGHPAVPPHDLKVTAEDRFDRASAISRSIDVQTVVPEYEHLSLRLEEGDQLRKQLVEDRLGDVLEDFDHEDAMHFAHDFALAHQVAI
ncbi:MAG TPA: hypothetical protein VHK65_05500 [Candidatus Dormibacteraeota bacterium]|nr:hypothetical protein [Candidatus Dormibacteraeota bacterium]